MRKIIALFFLIIFVILLASCQNQNEINIPPQNTDGQGSSIEDNSDNDIYVPVENEDGKLVYMDGSAFSKPTFTPYYHNYSSAISMTFDDGYDYETGYYVSRVYNKYGFTGTAMISASFVQNEYIQEKWKEIFSYGYLDLGVHGWAHANAAEITTEEELVHEIDEAHEFLKSVFTSQNVLTFATPYTTITDDYKAKIEKICIANRLGSNGKNTKLTGDLYDAKAISFGSGRSFSEIQAYLDAYAKRGEWISVLMHVISEEDVKPSEFDAMCMYLSTMENTWIASFERVAIYAKQLESSTLDCMAMDSEKITYKLSCSLDSSIYNTPMSAKIYLPSFVVTAYAEINGKTQHSFVERDPNGKYITVLDIPVGGEVFVYLGENLYCDNGCKNHEYVLKEEKNATCTECGYNLYMCEACGDTYKARYIKPKGHSLDYSKAQTVKAPTEYTTGKSQALCSICNENIEYLVRFESDE